LLPFVVLILTKFKKNSEKKEIEEDDRKKQKPSLEMDGKSSKKSRKMIERSRSLL